MLPSIAVSLSTIAFRKNLSAWILLPNIAAFMPFLLFDILLPVMTFRKKRA
jgi:hypothetical protein